MRAIDGDALYKKLNDIREEEIILHGRLNNVNCCTLSTALYEIENAPTIEPDRKKGTWIELGENPDGTHNICCGFCGVGKYKSKGHANSEYTKQRFKFCPNCGADLRGNDHDQDK